jgi:hypothetical protein
MARYMVVGRGSATTCMVKYKSRCWTLNTTALFEAVVGYLWRVRPASYPKFIQTRIPGYSHQLAIKRATFVVKYHTGKKGTMLSGSDESREIACLSGRIGIVAAWHLSARRERDRSHSSQPHHHTTLPWKMPDTFMRKRLRSLTHWGLVSWFHAQPRFKDQNRRHHPAHGGADTEDGM